MVRRGVCILLLLGYGAGHLTAVPHVHADEPSHQHGAAAPHIHVTMGRTSSPGHQHGRSARSATAQHHHHDHAHGGHHRHSEPGAAAPAADSADSAGQWTGAPHHDDDAVYLPTATSTGVDAGDSHAKWRKSPHDAPTVGHAPLVDVDAAGTARLTLPMQHHAASSAFCRVLRALRI